MGVTNRILELRKKHGLSQLELAKAIAVHQTAISQWETGKTSPDMNTIQALADYFNVTTDYLLGRTNEFTPSAKKDGEDDIDINTLEFALYGEVRELTDEDKEELLRMARRMRELEKLRKLQKDQK